MRDSQKVKKICFWLSISFISSLHWFNWQISILKLWNKVRSKSQISNQILVFKIVFSEFAVLILFKLSWYWRQLRTWVHRHLTENDVLVQEDLRIIIDAILKKQNRIREERRLEESSYCDSFDNRVRTLMHKIELLLISKSVLNSTCLNIHFWKHIRCLLKLYCILFLNLN